jgi:hypothetical protein
VSKLLSRRDKEVAKLTICYTDIGSVYISIYLPGHDIIGAGLFDFANLMRCVHQLRRIGVMMQVNAFLHGQKLQVERFL